MRSFTDTKNRTWELDINVFTVELVKSRTQINLFAVMENEFSILTQLLEDLFLRTRVLFVLVESQAKELKVSPEDFARGFSESVLTKSAEALIEAIADFFEGPKQSAMLHVLNTARAANKDLNIEGEAAVDQMRERLTPSGLVATLHEKFTAAQASSA